MRPPKVVGSESFEITERPPPESGRYTKHKWLSEADDKDFDQCPKGSVPLYVQKTAEEKMRNHAMHDPTVEVMGLMLGRVHDWKGEEYVLVKDVVTSDLESSAVQVRFDKEGYERLFDLLDDIEFEYIVVGWYHSHPGHGCFLSDIDVATQRSMFGESYHSAMVLDPINKKIAVFHMRDGSVEKRTFAVYWDRFQNPYHGTSIVMRKLIRKKVDEEE